MLLAFAGGGSISAIARRFGTNRAKVDRCVSKALQFGVKASLGDLPRRGRPVSITEDARAWLLSLACQKPKDLGYSYEMWTTRLLAAHVRGHCAAAGHPCLSGLSRGTVSKALTKSKIRPHKVAYYLERRDPDFNAKMTQVLCVYREVALLREAGDGGPSVAAYISYDEKPGIQAIENTAPDLPPVPGKHQAWARDHEYIRHGTVSLLAGIDLLTGEVHGSVEDRHRSREFVSFLKMLDKKYPPGKRLRIILDNHSAHASKETRAYLATAPGRFDFVFTPTHGSWLNIVETFFGKLTRTMLRGIRVASTDELKERILKYFDEINDAPTVFKWGYGIESSLVTNQAL
jgi:transposase